MEPPPVLTKPPVLAKPPGPANPPAPAKPRVSAKRNVLAWLVGAFVLSFLAVGLPYWWIPYRNVELPTSLMGPGLAFVGLACAGLRGFLRAHPLEILVFVAPSVPAVVIARIVVDVARDATTHNLFPFEVAIAVFVGGACAIAGIVIGSLALRFSR